LTLALASLADGLTDRLRDDKTEKIVVDDVDPSALDEFLSDHEYAAILFYSTSGGSAAAADRASSRLGALERDSKVAAAVFARVDDAAAAAAYGLPATRLPGLILFDDGVPEVLD